MAVTRHGGRRWPGSLRSLIIAGFLLALTPPLAALGWAAYTLNSLVAEVDAGLETAVAAARYGRGLVADVTELQRSARHWNVLQSDTLLDTYRERRKRVDETLGQLRALALDPERVQRLERLAAALPV
ncbi:MAG TPA: hypothetical protein PKH44_11065, partial [Plasticicumulans sp.]|nr:hypothetical protein [Plasticicumulans sp.]